MTQNQFLEDRSWKGKTIFVLEEIVRARKREGHEIRCEGSTSLSLPRGQISGTESSTHIGLGHLRSHYWASAFWGRDWTPHQLFLEAVHWNGIAFRMEWGWNTVLMAEEVACVWVLGQAPRGSHTPVNDGETNQKSSWGMQRCSKPRSKKDLPHWSRVSKSKMHKHKL